MFFGFNHQDKRLCENCRKPLGIRQMDCPRRLGDQDEECAYQTESGRIAKPGILLLVFAAILMGLPFVLPAGAGRASTLIRIGKGVMFFFGLGIGLVGCWRTWGIWQSAVSPVSRQFWRRTTLFGVEIGWVWESGISRIAWTGSPARGMRYPASVAEFFRQGNTVDLVATALLHLVAQGILSLGKQTIQRRFGRQQTRYLVLDGEAFGDVESLGLLESRMVEIVSGADLQGLTLAEFLHRLFECGQPQPRNFLIDRFIGPEAVSLELGKVVGLMQRALAPGPNVSARVGRDIQSVEQLHRDLWTTAPEEAAEFLCQLDLQIISLMRAGRMTG